MEPYIIERTKSSPQVEIDPGRGVVNIQGESFPENAAKFYEPVFEKLEEVLSNLGEGQALNVAIELNYFNSSSSKILLDLFERLEEATEEGGTISVRWFYHPENETIQECGEEFQEDVQDLDFQLQALE
jgi:hypothetical protein